MIKKDALIRRAKSNLLWSIVATLIFLGVAAYFVYDLIVNYMDLFQVILDSIVILISLFMVAVQTGWIVSYAKDIPLAKKDGFMFITGKMVRCNKVVTDKKTRKMTYFDPVIKDRLSGEEIQISVAGIEANKVYKIMYLKHSKIGIIDEKIK